MVRSSSRPTRKHSVAPEASLPILLAIDLAVAALINACQPEDRLLVLASAASIREEVAFRCSGQATMVAAASEVPAEEADRGFSAALWIAPERSTWRSGATAVDAVLAPGGCLVVVGAGMLVRSPLRPAALAPVSRAADSRRPGQALGYQTLDTWRLYGLRSAGWATLRVAADLLRRPYLADRFEAAYRLSMVMPGKLRGPSAVSVWIGRKRADR